MIRTRSVALLATVVLGCAGTLATVVGTAADAAPADGTGDVVGLVKEKGGDYLLDVNVEAIDRNGDVAASALTYESDLEPGQEGFFRLEVEPGRYRLAFSLDGYLTRVLPTKVRVGEGDELDLGTVTLLPEPRPSRTSAALKDNRITTTERGKVVVSVTSSVRPVGAVTVRYGRKVVGEAKLRAGDHGSVGVVLRRLDRGTYPLKAYFGGSTGIEGSKSRELKLTVAKPRHQRPVSYRPNVRPTY